MAVSSEGGLKWVKRANPRRGIVKWRSQVVEATG